MEQKNLTISAEGLPPEQQEIVDWLRTVKFKRRFFGGVNEAEVWRKIDELNRLYEKALLVERSRHNAGSTPEQEGEGHEA